MKNDKFATKCFRASKNLMGALIPALGLRNKVEEILIAKYVKGLGTWDIAEQVGITYESTMNALCSARNEMYQTIQNDYDILPPDIQKLIDKLLKD